LDSMTRKMTLPSGYSVLLSDTVGFIQDLPTTLIAAFRSTLEEVKEADLILHMIDSSHEDYEGHEATVKRLLEELEADDIPVLTVYNKRDRKRPDFIPSSGRGHIMTSAKIDGDLPLFKQAVEDYLKKELLIPYDVRIPASEGRLLSRIKSETMANSTVFDEDREVYEVEGYILPDQNILGELKKYM
ncbi:50S ribosome-binding GTPase, partial [Bacillus paralicheniformis]|uniref:GTPase n=1 Tax=Bacillus paralicheniformis TaxID=1648923 RepID=UPI002DB5FB3A